MLRFLSALRNAFERLLTILLSCDAFAVFSVLRLPKRRKSRVEFLRFEAFTDRWRARGGWKTAASGVAERSPAEQKKEFDDARNSRFQNQ